MRWNKNTGWDVTPDEIMDLCTTFPNLNIAQQLVRIDGWLRANSTQAIQELAQVRLQLACPRRTAGRTGGLEQAGRAGFAGDVDAGREAPR